jgi:hypothetical protein
MCAHGTGRASATEARTLKLAECVPSNTARTTAVPARVTCRGGPPRTAGSRPRRWWRRRIVWLRLRPWWRGENAGGRANTAADQGADPGTLPAADGAADCGTTTGANQCATRGALAGIVRIAASRHREHQAECGGTPQILADITSYHWNPLAKLLGFSRFPGTWCVPGRSQARDYGPRRRWLVLRTWRRGEGTGGRANAATDQGAGQRTWAATDGCANRGAATGANQCATRGALARIVRVGTGGYRQNQAKRGGTLENSVRIAVNHLHTPLGSVQKMKWPNSGETPDGRLLGRITSL